MSSTLQSYRLGNLGRILSSPEVSRFEDKLLVPPYDNDYYAGVFRPQYDDAAEMFRDPFYTPLQTAEEIVGRNRIGYSVQKELDEVHPCYERDVERLNKLGKPVQLLRTDFFITLDDGLRDPKYPPRVQLVNYLAGALSRSISLIPDNDNRSNDRPPKKHASRAATKRRQFVIQPCGTPSYEQFSEDEHGNPTELFAQNLYAFEGVVYAWGQVKTPNDERQRRPTFNAVPHLIKIFHSVRYSITTEPIGVPND
jgi:hypothetical protein